MIDHLYHELGEAPIAQLTAAFYRRVRQDDVIGPLYPSDDWEGAEQRLRDFLIYRFGGPDTYLRERGHPRLRARHLPFRIGVAERDRWLRLMREALIETAIPEAAAQAMMDFFTPLADFMRNTPEEPR